MAASLSPDVFMNPELSAMEVRLLQVIDHLQTTARVYKAEILRILNVSVSTLERRLRDLKRRGFLQMKRMGSVEWRYEFAPHITAMALHLTEPPQHIEKNYIYINKNITCEAPPEGPAEMSKLKLTGKPGKLLDALENVGSKFPPKPPKEAKPRIKRPWYEVARERMANKLPSQYNCTDMWLIFSDAWKENWRGAPPPWTGKDRGLMKRLITVHGAEDTAKYLKYVFSNWETLVRRYGIRGYPTVGLLSVYSKSFIPEMLNGEIRREGEFDATVDPETSFEKAREKSNQMPSGLGTVLEGKDKKLFETSGFNVKAPVDEEKKKKVREYFARLREEKGEAND